MHWMGQSGRAVATSSRECTVAFTVGAAVTEHSDGSFALAVFCWLVIRKCPTFLLPTRQTLTFGKWPYKLQARTHYIRLQRPFWTRQGPRVSFRSWHARVLQDGWHFNFNFICNEYWNAYVNGYSFYFKTTDHSQNSQFCAESITGNRRTISLRLDWCLT